MSADSPLTAIFLAALPAGPAAVPVARIEPILAGHLAAARAAWPDLAVPEERFLRYLARCVTAEPDLVADLAKLRAADLYLVCAYQYADERAALFLQQHYLPRAEAALMRLDVPEATRKDILQTVCQRLFGGLVDGAPRISYRGRGELLGWLCVTAVRELRHLARGTRRALPLPDEDSELLDRTLPVPEPNRNPDQQEDQERAYLQRLYRAQLKDAFQQALASLSSQERNLLRYHFLEGLNIEQIGVIFHVHRATVARWIVKVRQRLYTETRKALMQKIHVDRSEFESILRLVQSRLDFSIRQLLLGSRREPTED